MKIKSKQYAQALYEGIKDKNETEGKEIIARFVNLLIENNSINKKDKIIVQFNKIFILSYYTKSYITATPYIPVR